MCGIAGIYGIHQNPVDIHQVVSLTNSLTHRGPDDSGYLFFNTITGQLATDLEKTTTDWDFQIGFGHRRLSIIDLTPTGHQPMPNEDKTIWLIFNGEIYNYIELRSELKSKGHLFYSNTDSSIQLSIART